MSPIVIRELEGSLTVRFSGQKVVLDYEILDEIEAYWRKLLAEGKNYKRGEIFTVTGKKWGGDNLGILVEETDYAHYLYSAHKGGLGKDTVRIIHTAVLVTTSDHYVVFGEMGPQTARAGIYQLCGGGIDAEDLRGDTFDLESNAAKELQEEFSVDVSDKKRVKEFRAAYLKEGGPTDKMAVVYSVVLSETHREFLEKYQEFEKILLGRGELPEFGRVVALPLTREAIIPFLEERKERCDEYMLPLFQKVLE